MEKRKLEKLGIETSLLGFGCMRFPVTADGKIDEPEAERMLDRAIAAGVNYIDTAYPYHDGASEPFVGRALKKYDRHSFFLATKLPCWKVEKLEDVEATFQEQLGRLQTDYIDFYLMHALNKDSFHKMVELGAVEKLEALKAEGKIRYLGFSFHDGYDVFEEILNYRDWDFCQIQLNYMDTEEQAGMKGYRLTEEKGIPLVIMEPVKGGSLAAFAEDITGRFRALDPEASIASYALRWVGSLPNVKVILSGMSTMEQVQDNLSIFDVPQGENLTEADRRLYSEVKATYMACTKTRCTGCRYCQPCPMGVKIPNIFQGYDTTLLRHGGSFKEGYGRIAAENADASRCVGCRKCERSCPQQLPIVQYLKEIHSECQA